MLGILSHQISPSLNAMLPPGHNFTTYIDANYVRWAEAGGARVTPVVVDISSPQYYKQVKLSLDENMREMF